MCSAISALIAAGVISWLAPRYFASKSKKSFLEIISVMGSAIIFPFELKTTIVSSLPFTNYSKSTWSSYLKAFSIAAPSSSEGEFTLLMPMLEPPLFGFTNTGNFKFFTNESGPW